MSYPLPHISVPVVGPDNRMTEPWYLYYAGKEEAQGGLPADISSTGYQSRSQAVDAQETAELALMQAPRHRVEEHDIPSQPRRVFDITEALVLQRPIPTRNPFVFIPDTAANLANYAASSYPSAIYFETDTFVTRWSDGSAWTEFIFPALMKLLGSTSSFPALKRSAAILQARLADDSAYTDLEVLDEAYDATNWNGSVEVPTKNAVRDKVETLLIKNGVNFGPAAVASITIVDGQVTAIS